MAERIIVNIINLIIFSDKKSLELEYEEKNIGIKKQTLGVGR